MTRQQQDFISHIYICCLGGHRRGPLLWEFTFCFPAFILRMRVSLLEIRDSSISTSQWLRQYTTLLLMILKRNKRVILFQVVQDFEDISFFHP